MARKLNFKYYLKALKLIKADPALQDRFDNNEDGSLDPTELEKGAAVFGREIQRKSKKNKPRTKNFVPAKSQDIEKVKTGYISRNLLDGENVVYKTTYTFLYFIQLHIERWVMTRNY